MSEGTRYIQPGRTTIQLVEPWKAAENDPSLSDWLRLPLSADPDRPTCPECDSTHFGTVNPLGYLHVWRCHDEYHIGCNELFRGQPDLHDASALLEALLGHPKRLGTGASSEDSLVLKTALNLLEQVFGYDKGMGEEEWIDFCNANLPFMQAQGRCQGILGYS